MVGVYNIGALRGVPAGGVAEDKNGVFLPFLAGARGRLPPLFDFDFDFDFNFDFVFKFLTFKPRSKHDIFP